MPKRVLRKIGSGFRRLVNPNSEELLAQRTAKEQARMRRIIEEGEKKRLVELKKKAKKKELEEDNPTSLEEMKRRLQERYGKF